jgi:hypothetical protein
MIIYAGNAAFWSANLVWESKAKGRSGMLKQKLLGGESFTSFLLFLDKLKHGKEKNEDDSGGRVSSEVLFRVPGHQRELLKAHKGGKTTKRDRRRGNHSLGENNQCCDVEFNQTESSLRSLIFKSEFKLS